MNTQIQSQNPAPYLSVSSVSKAFGNAQVLKNIDLDCHAGELICLLGPSGCGKTTLLRIIAGLEQQDNGSLMQDGANISSLPAEKRDFGIVFQSYALFPNLTVTQNVAYGLRGQSREAIAKRVDDLLNTIGLSEHATKYPSQLSGGQQQRVALARALAISPGLLLLDEPLSALDAKVRIHLRQEIKSIQRRLGITTIMVTHDQDEAMSMADKIVVMNQGVIEQVGTPEEVYSQPATPFVAGFVGTMNFLPATVISNNTIESSGVEYGIANQFPSGEQIEIGIRPEYIDVAVDATGDSNAKIDKVEFLGAFVRLHITLQVSDKQQTLLVDVSNQQHLQNQYQENMDLRVELQQQHITPYAVNGAE